MQAGRKQLELLLAQAPADWAEGKHLPNGWSLKDLLLHLFFWEQCGAALYTSLAAGETPLSLLDALTIDQINAQAVAEGHSLSYHEVLTAERSAYKSLLVIAESALDTHLFDPACFAWTDGKPFANWLAMETYDHYPEHLADLQAAKSSRHPHA